MRKLIENEIPGTEFIEPSYDNEKDRRILEQKRHVIEIVNGHILDTENIKLIIQEARKAISTLVVCNHVPTAQAVYRLLKVEIDETVLLHGQFTRYQKGLFKNNNSNKLPKILVSILTNW